MRKLLISCLIRSFSLPASFRPMRVHLLNNEQNFKFPGFSDWLFQFLQTALDWWSYLHFCWYKVKINLILRLKKRRSSNNLDLHNSWVFSSDQPGMLYNIVYTIQEKCWSFIYSVSRYTDWTWFQSLSLKEKLKLKNVNFQREKI